MITLNYIYIMIKEKMFYIWSWRGLKDYAVKQAVI